LTSWAERVNHNQKPTSQLQNTSLSEEELCALSNTQMKSLQYTTKKIKEYCKGNKQDWVFFITGTEGSGKSTLASHIAKMLDPTYSADDSMIYSFRNGDHSLLHFMDSYRNTPYKVAWYDEAVTVLFSLRHNNKDCADAQEIFKISRDCQHYSLLVSPSFWDVVPDIRERRVKSLLYCFTEVYHPTQNRTQYIHKYAYFSGDKIIKLSNNKRAKLAFRSPRELFRLVKPNFIEEFPDMDADFKTSYLSAKRTNRDDILSRIRGPSPAEPKEKQKKQVENLLHPDHYTLDITALKKALYELNPSATEDGGLI